MKTTKNTLIGLLAVAAGFFAYRFGYGLLGYVFGFILNIPVIGRLFDMFINVLPGNLLLYIIIGYFGTLFAMLACAAVMGYGKMESTWPARVLGVILAAGIVLVMTLNHDYNIWGILRTVIWLYLDYTMLLKE